VHNTKDKHTQVSKMSGNHASVVSQKQLVLQLRKLATNPEHCRALVQNNQCVKTLVQTLESSDQETVLYCVQTLLIISQNESYRPILQRHHLQKSLQFLKDSPNTEISSTSMKLWAKLFPNTDKHQSHDVQRHAMHATQKLRKITLTLKNINNPSRRKHLHNVCSTSQIIASYTYDEKKNSSNFFVHNAVSKAQIQNFLSSNGFEEKETKQILKPRAANNTQLKRYTSKKTRQTMTLKERLKRSKELKEEKEKQSQKADSWFSSVSSYVW